MIAMLVSAGAGWAGVAMAQTSPQTTDAAPLSKVGYTQAIKDADARYKSARSRCASLAGNAKDICAADARGSQSVAKAEAEAAYKPTPKAREEARIARADATYQVAIERCDDLAGNPKDVCVKEAKSGLVNGRANAKVDRVAADTSREAAATQAEARKDANEDKREAELKVAIEKCDALSGAAKDACVKAAKSQYGRS
jgi:hypothetical protein